MRAYSGDLRERVVGAVEEGESQVRVAAIFSVSPATVKRWVGRRRRNPDDDLSDRKSPGRPPKVLPGSEAALRSQLQSHPAATLTEHVRLWGEEQGVELSIYSMSRAIRRVGWTRKKGVWGPVSGTSGLGISTGPE